MSRDSGHVFPSVRSTSGHLSGAKRACYSATIAASAVGRIGQLFLLNGLASKRAKLADGRFVCIWSGILALENGREGQRGSWRWQMANGIERHSCD